LRPSRNSRRPENSYNSICVSISGHRFYLPEIGMWPKRDPADETGFVRRRLSGPYRGADEWFLHGGIARPYRFVLNAPIVYVDLIGLQAGPTAPGDGMWPSDGPVLPDPIPGTGIPQFDYPCHLIFDSVSGCEGCCAALGTAQLAYCTFSYARLMVRCQKARPPLAMAVCMSAASAIFAACEAGTAFRIDRCMDNCSSKPDDDGDDSCDE